MSSGNHRLAGATAHLWLRTLVVGGLAQLTAAIVLLSLGGETGAGGIGTGRWADHPSAVAGLVLAAVGTLSVAVALLARRRILAAPTPR